MECYEKFDKQEAVITGLCKDCSTQFCDAHPRFQEWRKGQGLPYRKPFMVKAQVILPELLQPPQPPQLPTPPTPKIPFFAFDPKQGSGVKRGRISLDFVTSQVIGSVLSLQVRLAKKILEAEGMKGWTAISKRNVWATCCKTHQKLVQFGEGCAILHYNLKSSDTVSKEMRRYGWENGRKQGWMMTVIHEVAHACNPLHDMHGRGFHETLRRLRTKYYDLFVNEFDVAVTQKVAANNS